MKVRCGSCRKPFEAQRSTAKFCSPTCRQRARRNTAAKTSSSKKPAKKTAPKRASKKPAKKAVAKKTTNKTTPRTSRAALHRLVTSVKRELEQRQVVDSVLGQQALELARRLANPEETGASALSRELRVVMASIAHTAAKSEDEGDGEPEDDEVTRARKARAQARQKAGLS